MRTVVMVALLALATACSSAGRPLETRIDLVSTENGLTKLDLHVGSFVVVSGEQPRTGADGSTSFTSSGSERRVEVRVGWSQSMPYAFGVDFQEIGGVKLAGDGSDPTGDFKRSMKARREMEEKQDGDYDLILARSATISPPNEGTYTVVLHDALLHGATEPIPTVTVSWKRPSDSADQ